MTMSDEEGKWWESSPFVWIEEDEVEAAVPPPTKDALETLLEKLIPALRLGGEAKLTDLSPSGITEWIPGVDPMDEMLPESFLPPLPPAVTTQKRVYRRGKDEEGGASGHVNIMVDLSGSMTAPIGPDENGQMCNIITAAQALTVIVANACMAGGHTISVFGYGSDSGDQVGAAGRTTRQIWGFSPEEMKDHQGLKNDIRIQRAEGDDMSGGWGSMGGTYHGPGMRRVYEYMDTVAPSEIKAATCIFISDAFISEFSPPTQGPNVDKAKTMDPRQQDDMTGPGWWHWAKKYHDDFGPVMLFVLNAREVAEEGSKSVSESYGKWFSQLMGNGKTGYAQCATFSGVFMDASGGNIPQLAKLMVKAVRAMDGLSEPNCGGKGVTF